MITKKIMKKEITAKRIVLLAVVCLCGIVALSLFVTSFISSQENSSEKQGISQGSIPKPKYWPTNGWNNSTPEGQGIDSAKLADALLQIRQKDIHIHSLTVIRNGLVVLDANFYPYDGKTVHELASVTKSLMTTLIAIAAGKGILQLDQPMLSFFPNRSIANRDALKERITIKHLASMSSGLESMGYENGEGTLQEMMATQDWVQFALDRKVVFEPGTHFVYDSPGMHILSAILEEATGITSLQFARENLFYPLGIRDVIWPADPQGFNKGWGDIFLHPHDLAKIGYLWINDGIWDDEQIVSSDWVKESVKPLIKTDGEDYYGYGWWVSTNGNLEAYSANGRGGQYLIVVPNLNLIVVTTGGGFDFDEIETLITPAIVGLSDPLPQNPDGVARLNAALKIIARAPEPKPVPPLPDTARNISNRTILFEPNPLKLKTLLLDFNDLTEAGIKMTFTGDQSPRQGNMGLDGVYRISPGQDDFPAGYRGYWVNDQTFVLEIEEIAHIEAFTVRLQFEGDLVMVNVKERTLKFETTFNGRMQSWSNDGVGS